MMSTYQNREIVKRILKHMQTKEDKTKTKKIWSHREFDSNQTNFEFLSNQDVIGFATTLKGKDVGLLMHLFQCLFDHNSYSMEDFMNHPDLKTMNDEQLYRLCMKTLEITSSGENEKVRNVKVVYNYDLLFALF